jgi:glycerol-3-phosphate cytidylyltransferase-like family protein
VGERERARVLAALAAVDAVVVFGEPTPLELIVATRPDVIVKGGDYGVETVVGASEVQSWGGQVKIVPLVEGFSTTRLITAKQPARRLLRYGLPYWLYLAARSPAAGSGRPSGQLPYPPLPANPQ